MKTRKEKIESIVGRYKIYMGMLDEARCKLKLLKEKIDFVKDRESLQLISKEREKIVRQGDMYSLRLQRIKKVLDHEKNLLIQENKRLKEELSEVKEQIKLKESKNLKETSDISVVVCGLWESNSIKLPGSVQKNCHQCDAKIIVSPSSLQIKANLICMKCAGDMKDDNEYCFSQESIDIIAKEYNIPKEIVEKKLQEMVSTLTPQKIKELQQKLINKEN